MCGRYSLTQINGILRILGGNYLDSSWTPRYNIAPSQMAPIIVEEEGAKALREMKWGLVPAWAKDPGVGFKMINARAETLMEKPSFRKPFASRRCLVPADGFYEWQEQPGLKEKIPWRIRLKSGDPFTFAGLWENSTFTIITTEANDLVLPLHQRMPVILPTEAAEAWLEPQGDPGFLLSLLQPYPVSEMEASTVSDFVNSPRNEGPALWSE